MYFRLLIGITLTLYISTFIANI